MRNIFKIFPAIAFLACFLATGALADSMCYDLCVSCHGETRAENCDKIESTCNCPFVIDSAKSKNMGVELGKRKLTEAILAGCDKAACARSITFENGYYKSMDKGRTTLRQDNITLELEEGTMRDLTKQLNQRIEMATDLDAYLTGAIEKARAEGQDPDRIRFLEEEVLFPLRQKIMDFQQLLVVNQQGIVAMDVVRRNNNELIRAVDRAEHVTVASLRTAVTVAGALYNQKIVLEKVQALNATTNEMITATSRMLREQGVAIQQQATEAAISPETLKAAFNDALAALQDISTYKQRALPQMQQTIAEFREIAEEGERALQQMEDAGAFDDVKRLQN
jgi:hypothetical protein